MASTDRAPSDSVARADSALTAALREAPYAFHVFQALRRLECRYWDKPRLGQALRPSDEPVRLTQAPSLAFAPSTLAAFDPGNAHPPRLAQYFFGLFGPQGPLPLHLTEYAYERQRQHGDPTFARFLDVFHHRLLCLFYRAWANAQPAVSFDRPEEDRFAVYVGSLFGLGMPSLWRRDAVPDLAKWHYAGRLVAQTRHPEGLQAILADFFKLPVSIETFVGHWLALDPQSQCRLGDSEATGLLGETAVIGTRVWDCQHKFRLVIGPLRLAEYQRFLPNGASLTRLAAWVRNYIGDELIWDVNLILRKDEVPPLQLGSEINRLGWTSWLTSQPMAADADDLYLDVLAYLA